MLAIVYDKNSQDKLVLQEVDMPVPKESEVLVRIHTVSVNAADYRSMKMGLIPKHKIFGADIAGEIIAVGSKVTNLKVGDRVFGDIAECGFGGFAEYVAVPEENYIARIPEGIIYDTAAALPMASVTALQALRKKGKINPYDKVLVVGGGGGVGTYAIQLAKYFGAEVTAVCSSKNAERMKTIGADHVINYEKEDFLKQGRQYQRILAVNGSYSMLNYKRALSPKGVYVMIGGAISQLIRSLLLGPILSFGSKKLCFLSAKPDVQDLTFIMKLVAEGKVVPVIDRFYPFTETAKAVNYLAQGHAQGKVVIRVLQN